MVAQERRFTPRRHRRRMRNQQQQQQYYGYSEQERGGRGGGGYGQQGQQGQQRGGPIRRHQQSHSEFGIQGRRESLRDQIRTNGWMNHDE